jgi:hypothetical protein
MYIGTIIILYHDVNITMGFQIIVLILREPLGIALGSKVPFHSSPKPHHVPFLKQGLDVDIRDVPWRAK